MNDQLTPASAAAAPEAVSSPAPGRNIGAGPGKRARRAIPPRVIALFWSAPFIVFLAYPIIGAVQAGLDKPGPLLLLSETLALGIVYIAAWLVLDSAPRDASHWKRYLVMVGLIAALQVVILVTNAPFGGSGAVFLICYLVSPMALLSPPRWMFPSLALGLALAAIEILVRPSEGYFPLVVILMTTTVTVLSRLAMDHERLKDVETKQEIALSRERERARISADLHDILGQTLTGITVKADLAGRLLDAGRVDEARAQLDDLTEMSRAALSDVRDVVAANRTLLPDTEIEAAREVLETVEVRLVVIREGEPAPGAPSTLVAHVIREGCTNAYKHAAPTVVTVTVRADGASVVNDGVKRRGMHAMRHALGSVGSAGDAGGGLSRGGTGLDGLRERVGSRGTLTWGGQGDAWTLDLRLHQVGGA